MSETKNCVVHKKHLFLMIRNIDPFFNGVSSIYPDVESYIKMRELQDGFFPIPELVDLNELVDSISDGSVSIVGMENTMPCKQAELIKSLL